MPIDLKEALEHHRRGRLELAARTYEAALAENPEHAEALHLLGLVALQQEDSVRALSLIARAAALRPADALIHANLAEVYRAQGELDQAAEACRTALRIQPDYPEAHCNLGSILVRQGRLDAGIAHFHEALRLNPGFAAAHNNLGNALRLKGEKSAALGHFRSAAVLDPRSAEAHSNLGEMLLELGEPKEALVHCRQAVQLRPSLPAAHSNLGNALQALGRLDEAQASLREAIRLDPGLAAPCAGLAQVLEQLGDFEGALSLLREVLRRDARHAGALARLATRLGGDLPHADIVAIEALLADPHLPPEARWQLQFGLAQTLDARGDFERAASLTIQANALQLADFRKRGQSYQPHVHHDYVDRLIAAFGPEFFERVRGFGLESERPVFIVGLPRSGTSLTEQVLASHPRVFGAGELRLAQQTFEALPEATGRTQPPLDCLTHLDRAAAQRLAGRHLHELAALDQAADRVTDKMPENTLYLGLLAALFPRAKLIHCRRDLRDVALSCWLTNFGQVRWACDADHIASRFAEYKRIMAHWRKVLPVPIFDIRYETMVADLEGVARQLVAFCGLEWDAACLEFHKSPRPVRTPSVAQVRQPVYKSSVGRWRNYEHLLADLFTKLPSDR